jgi:SAM-dependent methyltransferase
MTAYDETLYPGRPYPQSHPAHLAAVATLFGMSPAPVERCRVLEVACGDAANLIPMALGLSGSEFVGFDLARRPIEAGKGLAAQLGLRNLSLGVLDLREFPNDTRPFDYIIAHGLYSWVPGPVRDQLLSLIAKHLAPQGVAFVSYNVYPGCYIRRMLWEMLRFHTEHLEDPAQRAAEAQTLLRLLADGQSYPNDYGTLLRAEAARVLEREAAYLLHDDLAEVNEPVYFHQFLDHAQSHGLQYVGEAELGAMSTAGVTSQTRAVLEPLDPLMREQYLDFVRGRQFRQTLLCRDAVELDRTPSAARLDGLLLSMTARAQIAAHGTPDEQVLRTLVALLEERYPHRLSLEQTQISLRERLGEIVSSRDAGYLPGLILLAVRAGLLDIHAGAPAVARHPSERPQVFPLARLQSERGITVTNLCHDSVKLDDKLARTLVALLDGTRDRTQLMQALGEQLDGDQPRAEALEAHLQNLARLALLVP